MSDTTVRLYGPGQIVSNMVTVAAAPSSVADASDEANVAAVDAALVDITPQSAIGGSDLCLVLRANIGVLHGIVEGITYQVTVLSDYREGPPAMRQLAPGTTPDD